MILTSCRVAPIRRSASPPLRNTLNIGTLLQTSIIINVPLLPTLYYLLQYSLLYYILYIIYDIYICRFLAVEKRIFFYELGSN